MTTLSLEQVAALRAALDLSPHPDEVLREAALDRDAFAAAETHWLDALAEDLDRGETKRLELFRQQYEAARTARGAPPPPRTSEESSPSAPSAHAPLGQPPLAPPATSPSAPLFARPLAAPPAPPPPPPGVEIDATAEMDMSAFRRAAASAVIPFVAPIAAIPPPPAPPVSPEPSGTEEMDMSRVRAAIAAQQLPFAQSPAQPSQGKPAQPQRHAPPLTPPQAAPLPVPTHANVPAPIPAPTTLPRRTAFLDERAPAQGARLPFKPGPAAPPPANAAVRPGLHSEPRISAMESRATVALSDGVPGDHTLPPNLDRARGAAVPFPTASPESLMPLERYVEITVALERDGQPLVTFQRFGLDPSAWMKVLRAYNIRFAEDPALKARFDALVTRTHGR